MKNKKKAFLIGGISLAVVVAIILCIVLLPKKPATDTPKPTETTDSTESNLVLETPIKDENGNTVLETVANDDGTGLKPIIEEDKANNDKNTSVKATETAKPITAKVNGNTNTKDEGTTGGISINGGENIKYSCGVAGHHCDGPETHAYILNLEIQGCKYCGSHSCKSFYATDEWGNTCYSPSKCSKYDVKKDPVHYCQNCGKKSGDGKNGTCVQFVESCNCPLCGKHVDAWTCHSCK